VQPIGPLMREHRLIERILTLLQGELAAMETGKGVHPIFIDTVVDFFKTYADMIHHGKEEGIYFRDLAGRDITTEHRRIMEELIKEHAYTRGEVRALLAANQRYLKGESEYLEDLKSGLAALIGFYPRHIHKEEKHFFLPTQEYLTKVEREAMLKEFQEFDAGITNEKYSVLVKRIEGTPVA
jgi:hemerythrin-like domain-containing protein